MGTRWSRTPGTRPPPPFRHGRRPRFCGRQALPDEMNTTTCYIRLWQYCREAGADVIGLDALREGLRAQVGRSITRDTEKWETDYVCKPSQFFNTRGSVFYADNKELADYECEFIVKTQLEDGSWNIPWAWKGYPEQWAVSKNWWRANVAIWNMLYLKGMGMLT